MHLQYPPIIAGNQWQVTRQEKIPDVGHLCTISAGEMDVTQFGRGKDVAVQVATSSSINPGDYYHVAYGNDVHVTANGSSKFSPRESQAIVADLLKGGIVYTEIQQQVIHGAGSEYQRLGNKIRLDGFLPAYQACRRFVTSPARQ